MEKICRNCIFWKEDTEKHGDVGKTYVELVGYRIGDCSSPKFVYTGDGGFAPKDGMSYTDYESYAAFIETGEDFSCPHFTIKEEV